MHHYLKLTTQEKWKAWLNLCDFTFNLLKDNLGKGELKRRLQRMRASKLRIYQVVFENMSKRK